jgi:N-acetylneuraminic acid mutarotase
MKIGMMGVFALLMVAHKCPAQGYWTQLGDMPEIRYAHTVNELNGKIYVVGGGSTEGSPSPRTALVYDTSSGIWTQIPHYNNKVRVAHCSCVLGGRLYVVGGQDSSGSLATMDMFDPNSGQWVSKNSMPTDRGLAACATIENKIYVIGGARFKGTDYTYIGLQTVEVYDTNSGTWTRLADMLTGRWGHSAAAVNGKIYVFGGASVSGGWNVYSSEVYNPQTNTWTTISNMPTARYCLTTCSLESNIYTIGGWLHSQNGPIYDKVEVYNPESDTWHTETPMPVARAVLASIVLDGKMYVYGGARTTHPNIGTSAVYEYRKEPGLAYAHYARFSRYGRDTVGITTWIENPLAHTLHVVGILTLGSGKLIDSLLLKDDGFHGDSSSADDLWGNWYVPKKDDTIHVTIRTDDLMAGTSRTLPDAATMLFTRGALISVDTRMSELGPISMNTSRYDTSFSVRNIGYSADSLTVSLDPGTVVPDTAVSAFPKLFTLAPGDSQKVTFRIRPNLLSPQYYVAQVIVEPKSAFGPARFEKNYQFQVVVTGSVSDLAALPTVYVLDQNYPNPFNPSTTIKYELPKPVQVRLSVYDMLGREVSVLVNERREAGVHEVRFDGSGLSSGVYFYRLQAGDFVQSKRMLVLK